MLFGPVALLEFTSYQHSLSLTFTQQALSLTSTHHSLSLTFTQHSLPLISTNPGGINSCSLTSSPTALSQVSVALIDEVRQFGGLVSAGLSFQIENLQELRQLLEVKLAGNPGQVGGVRASRGAPFLSTKRCNGSSPS